MRCEVRTKDKSTYFELLSEDKVDNSLTQCSNEAAVLVDWKNGRSTRMCLEHDALSSGLEYKTSQAYVAPYPVYELAERHLIQKIKSRG